MKLLEKENHSGQSPSPEIITHSDMFPEGLRVLAVDDDPVCLIVLERILKKCHYKVTVTKEAVDALKKLRENKNNFDIVLTDVIMSDMDGFRLLEIIGLEMDIPVIMMSSNEDQATVMKGIEHGACDYLLKPIRLDVIKNIWQHVIRKSKFDNNDLNVGKGMIKGIASKGKKRPNSQIKGDLKEDESNVHSDENGPTRRKRVTWTTELHIKFIQAWEKLEPDKAVPSKILEEMNEPNLTREQVASHLQKYRTALKKTGGQQKNDPIGSNETNALLTNVAVLSYDNQRSNGVNHLNDFRTNGPNSSQMTRYGHHIQNPDAFSHSFEKPMSCYPSQPNLLSQPFPNNLEVLDETCHRIPVHVPRDIYSDSVKMENPHHQSCLNRLSQFFSPITNFCNGVMELSSRMSGYNASNSPRPSILPLSGCTSNSLPVNNSFDFSDYPILYEAHLSNTSLPDYGITTQEILPGLPEGISLVHMDMQNSNVVNPFEDEELPLGKDCFDQLSTDDLYHLSSCSSTEDGLNAIVKQSMTMLR